MADSDENVKDNQTDAGAVTQDGAVSSLAPAKGATKEKPVPDGHKTIILGKPYIVSGQIIKIEEVTKKVKSGGEVVIHGLNLKVFDQVALWVAGQWYRPVNIYLARQDGQAIEFCVPNFDEILVEGDSIWVRLSSSLFPTASGTLNRYIKYTFKDENEEEDKKKKEQKKKQAEEAQANEGKNLGNGLTGLAVASAGEAISGMAASFMPSFLQKESALEKAKNAVKSGDAKALKEAVDKSKELKDLSGLKKLLKDAGDGESRKIITEAVEALQKQAFSPQGLSAEDLGTLQGDSKSGSSELEYEDDSSPEVVQATEHENLALNHSQGAEYQQGAETVPNNTNAGGKTRVVVSGKSELEESETNIQQINVSSASAAEAAEAGITSQNFEISGSASGSESQEVSASVQSNLSSSASAQASVRSRQSVSGQASATSQQSNTTTETQKTETTGGSNKISEQGKGSSSRKQTTTTENQAEEEVQASPSSGPGRVSAKQTISSPSAGQTGGQGIKGVEVERVSANPNSGSLRAGEVDVSVRAPTSSAGISLEMEEAAQAPQGPRQVKAVIDRADDQSVFLEKTNQSNPAVPKSSIGAVHPSGVQAQSVEAPGLSISETAELQENKEKKPGDAEDSAISSISPEAREAALLFKARENSRNLQSRKLPGIFGNIDIKAGGRIARRPNQDKTHLNSPESIREAGPGRQSFEIIENQNLENGGNPSGPEAAGESTGEAAGPQGPGGEPEKPDEQISDRLPSAETGQSPAPGGAQAPVVPAVPGDPRGQSQQKKSSQRKEKEQPGEIESGEESSAPSQELSDRLDKLAEDKKLDAEIKRITKEANLLLDQALMEGVGLVWVSCELIFPIPLGAFIGDFLWAFKNSIIKNILKPLLRTEALKKKGDEIAKEIKISTKVKLNILAWNLITAAAVMLLFLVITLFVWVGCNYPPGLSKISYKLTVIGALGGSSICESLNNMSSKFSFSGGDSGGAGASDSWGSGGLLSTNQWTSQINQAASQYSVDPCILRVVVQKESGGQANIIGCDCAANGKPELCPAGARGQYTPSYQFNWDQCSYGIGLTQWTIYQRSSSANWNRWENQSTPSRNVLGDKYYNVSDFLDPQTSLNLTARAFKNYLNQSGGSVAGAFRSYMGNGAPQSWVDQRMALYNMCKSSGGQ